MGELPNIYLAETTVKLHQRIDALCENSQAQWGQMNASQMLAHCQVVYEQILGRNNAKPGMFMGWMLRKFFKESMVNSAPYKKNLPTGPVFVKINQEFDLEVEKEKLKNYMVVIQEYGPLKMETIPSLSLKKLSAKEWNNMLYKHIDHHLKQFGV